MQASEPELELEEASPKLNASRWRRGRRSWRRRNRRQARRSWRRRNRRRARRSWRRHHRRHRRHNIYHRRRWALQGPKQDAEVEQNQVPSLPKEASSLEQEQKQDILQEQQNDDRLLQEAPKLNVSRWRRGRRSWRRRHHRRHRRYHRRHHRRHRRYRRHHRWHGRRWMLQGPKQDAEMEQNQPLPLSEEASPLQQEPKQDNLLQEQQNDESLLEQEAPKLNASRWRRGRVSWRFGRRHRRGRRSWRRRHHRRHRRYHRRHHRRHHRWHHRRRWALQGQKQDAESSIAASVVMV